MLEKNDILLEMNFHNNYEIIANWILKLKTKHPNNLKIKEMEKSLCELYFYTNNLQILLREKTIDHSNLKLEFNKFKKEFYSLNTKKQ